MIRERVSKEVEKKEEPVVVKEELKKDYKGKKDAFITNPTVG